MPDPTPAARLALAVRGGACIPGGICPVPCATCRHIATAVARELAQILRERHGGSSTTADWLDGIGCHE